MASMNMNLPLSRVTKDLTIHVAITGLAVFKLRLWIAGRLLYLAAWILQCGIKIDIEKGIEKTGTWGDEIDRIQRNLKGRKK